MLYFITSNENKANVAKSFLDKHDVTFTIKPLELPEIQSESPEEIALYKADFAFNELKQPLFVTDHFWSITALHGFPGAYMKYINKWLTADDLLRLMDNKEDREVFLYETLCYIDNQKKKTFIAKHRGEVLREKQGNGIPAQEIISLTNDGISVQKKLETNHSALEVNELYSDFAKWLKEN